MTSVRQAASLTFAAVKEGQTAVLERSVGEAEVAAFAKLSGDYSPLHVDEAFAKTTRFKGRVAHGMILGSFVSTLVGMDLPGCHAILLSVSLEFRKPVLLGDSVRVEARVARKVEAFRMLELEVKASNQRGETVADGSAKVLVTA